MLRNNPGAVADLEKIERLAFSYEVLQKYYPHFHRCSRDIRSQLLKLKAVQKLLISACGTDDLEHLEGRGDITIANEIENVLRDWSYFGQDYIFPLRRAHH